MSAFDCTDSHLAAIMEKIDTGQALLNPQASLVDGLMNMCLDRSSDVGGHLLSVLSNPYSPTFTSDLTSTLLLQTKLAEIGGGNVPHIIGDLTQGIPPTINFTQIATENSVLGRYMSFTDFLSGQGGITGKFPVNVMGMTAGIPNAAMLGGLTFVGLLGVASSGLDMGQALCEVPSPPGPGETLPPGAPDPCGLIKKIFGAVMGALNTVLNAISNGLSLLNQGIAYVMHQINAIVDMIMGAVNDLIAGIMTALNAIVDTILKALKYAMAGLLAVLNKIPCFKDVMGAVAQPAFGDLLNAVT